MAKVLETACKVVAVVGGVLIVASFFWMTHAMNVSQEARIQMLDGQMSYVEYSKINYQVSHPVTLEITGVFLVLGGLIGYAALEQRR